MQEYRVWNIVNIPNDPDYYRVGGVGNAIEVIEQLSDLQLLNQKVTSNAFGLQVKANGQWEDWTDENGDTIDEYVSR